MSTATHADGTTAANGAKSAPDLRPLPPLAKRLNRNALTVAAVIMGITVLTAVVLLNPSNESRKKGQEMQARSDESPPIPARPSFLDAPPRGRLAVTPQALTQGPGAKAVWQRPDGDRALAIDSAQVQRSTAIHEAPQYVGPSPDAAMSVRTREPNARERAYLAAVNSPALVAATLTSSNAPARTDPPALADEETRLLNLGDSVLRASIQSSERAGFTSQGSQPLASNSALRTGSDPRRAFLDAAGDARGSTVVARMEPPGSPYTLRAGTVIPGVLLTGISSDLPGDIVGQVSRNVYDSRTQRVLLIPKGARLIGTYDNQVVGGQNRLLVAWTRLILPDGQSMRLPGLALKDPQGQTGAKGGVDNHWRRVFGNALLLSAIGAGVQLSQPQQASVLAPPSAGQVAAGALGQELSNVALEIIRRGMDVQPTITIRQGQPFNVFLNGDLVFGGPYAESTPER
jgi:type IV secretory pathway VirB10-like protein